MQKSNHNCKIRKDYDLIRMEGIKAAFTLEEDLETRELEDFLKYLQGISRMFANIIVQWNNMHGIFAMNTLKGLRKDLEEHNRDIDLIQNIIQQRKKYQNN